MEDSVGVSDTGKAEEGLGCCLTSGEFCELATACVADATFRKWKFCSEVWRCTSGSNVGGSAGIREQALRVPRRNITCGVVKAARIVGERRDITARG